MIPFVKKYLLANWSELKLGERPDDLLFIKFPDRRIRSFDVGTITFLVKGIINKKETALFILRVPRYPASKWARQTLENEYNNLRLVNQKIKDPEISSAIPQALLFTEVQSAPVLIISLLAGKDLGKEILSQDILKSYVTNFNLAFSWLVGFQRGWKGETVEFNQEFVDEFINGTIDQYKKTFPERADFHAKYFSKITSGARKFLGKKIIIYPQHGDFHAANMFAADNKISGLIDWEDFNEKGLPCHDLFHYIKTYLEALFELAESMGEVAAIDAIAQSPSWGKAILDLAGSYCRAVGIDAGLMEIFLPVFLIETLNVAGSPRKMAGYIIRKNEVLMQLQPFTIDQLRLYMSIFSYGNLFKKALAEKNNALAKVCQEKVKLIQQLAEKNKQSG